MKNNSSLLEWVFQFMGLNGAVELPSNGVFIATLLFVSIIISLLFKANLVKAIELYISSSSRKLQILKDIDDTNCIDENIQAINTESLNEAAFYANTKIRAGVGLREALINFEKKHTKATWYHLKHAKGFIEVDGGDIHIKYGFIHKLFYRACVTLIVLCTLLFAFSGVVASLSFSIDLYFTAQLFGFCLVNLLIVFILIFLIEPIKSALYLEKVITDSKID
ncbi:hypothetical protein [Pseudoalteromonas luteoviolacea]|uniref:Uncharacterized protein n=1 Tax=Pseudoalteromonas luteoviolacea DSM 6061 TaxID=1365250 RepID=A0A166VYC3_9GAMM|nr:hypothetical protein [Pseudoalteromonas luteoviolacea]KZN34411.1 hypothetical protein N475_19220 [Pseudoalteromonas luteoviolacea DSM 6061]MBE0389871.1 hypothetical protein [Pseudoalteromonas luteoviolacea DSM 6061]